MADKMCAKFEQRSMPDKVRAGDYYEMRRGTKK